MAQREFPSAPLAGVGAVVIDASGRVLLVKRGSEPIKGRWSIPGGLIELGEALTDAVKREIEEETGLRVEPQGVIEVVDRIHRIGEGQDERVQYHYILVNFWCVLAAGQSPGAAAPSSDAAEIAWIGREQWLEDNPFDLEELTRQVIEKGWQMAKAAGAHGLPC